MHNRTKLLRLISDGDIYSGEELGNALGVSRTAIWKTINLLGHFGLKIIAVKGKGYQLSRPIEFLDKDAMLSVIGSPALEILNRLEIFEEIDSTNQYFLENPNISDKHANVALAEYQAQGRGRRGKSWVSPIGSGISLSICWHFEQPVESLTCLSLAVGSTVIKVLEKTGFKDIGLKWPNDIFFQGKKLGGLLIEMRGETAGPCDVVIGLGLNVAFPIGFEGNIEQAWTDLVSIKGSIPSRNHLAAELSAELILLLDGYAQANIEDIIDEWRQYDCMRGKQVTLILSDRKIHGLVMGIDADGALLMSVDDDIQKYNAGEISVQMKS